MKRLTINDIAKASLRGGKRAYLSLAIGIFLSIFLITGVAVTADCFYAAKQVRTARDVGYQNFFLLDDTNTTDSELMESGMFESIGHVYVTSCVADTTRYLGYYDETGEALLNRRMEAGRMPEKAGEIAAERSALENLRLEAQVGDVIELDLIAVDGVRETRSYTVTGILAEQSVYLNADAKSWSYCVAYFPSMIVHEDEPAFSAGRVAVHRLLKKSENANFAAVMNYYTNWERSKYLANFYGIYNRDEIYNFAPMAFYLDDEALTMYAGLFICALALLTATGTGIAQAMESRLAQKREEIGMLRAVGATRRQIRKIFGREAWLLALLLSPISAAGGCAFVWIISKIAPEYIAFQLNWRLIVPVILFSALCILMAASLPLRRASKIYPMSVIRDTELLRKSRAIRPKKQFKAPRLISGRQLRLYPTRQIGATVLVVMMLLFIALSGGYIRNIVETVAGSEGADFSMGCYWSLGASEFIDVLPETNITLQDIHQIRAIEQVDKVRYYNDQEIMILRDVDGLPEYLAYMERYGDGNQHLDDDPESDYYAADQYRMMRAMYGIETDVINAHIVIADEATVAEQAEFVSGGEIDMAAINAGREVIMYLPDIYLSIEENGDMWTSFGKRSKYAPEGLKEEVLTNDIFHAGETLDLMQLWHTASDIDRMNAGEDDYFQNLYSAANRVNASVTIGAVLKDKGFGYSDLSIITTMEGALAMGLKVQSTRASIWLKDREDEEAEAYVEKRIEAIAARGEHVEVRNNLEGARQRRREGIGLMLACLCASVVFLAVAVSMIAGNIRRRILADKRMIGTLRAVGADRKALIGCYGGQVESAVGVGLVAALGLYAWLASNMYRYNTAGAARDIPGVIAGMLLFSLACWVFCRLSMKRSISLVMKKSIVENIREL